MLALKVVVEFTWIVVLNRNSGATESTGAREGCQAVASGLNVFQVICFIPCT